MIEIVRRGVDMIANAFAEIDVTVAGKLPNTEPRTTEETNDGNTRNYTVRKKTVERIINFLY